MTTVGHVQNSNTTVRRLAKGTSARSMEVLRKTGTHKVLESGAGGLLPGFWRCSRAWFAPTRTCPVEIYDAHFRTSRLTSPQNRPQKLSKVSCFEALTLKLET